MKNDIYRYKYIYFLMITCSMMVPKKIIEDIISVYSLESKKYIQAVTEIYPVIYGTFSINHSCYLKDDFYSDHLTFTDCTICCNELGYVGFANALKNKKIPELEDISYDFVKSHQVSFEICSIREFSFHSSISPDKFSGILAFNRIRKLNNTYFMDASINFDNKIFGEIIFNTKFR